MNPNAIFDNRRIYYRLVALWAFCEGFAGGIMHMIKVPFAGMFVSSLAVLCIILIGFFIGAKAILKATVIVAIFKLLLSPHSPPTAYIALFFQGLMGSLLLSNKKYFTAGAIALGFLALVESSIQRILVLIILYGNSFWQALNEYLTKLTGANKKYNYSLILATLYIILHGIIGIVVGKYGSLLAKKTKESKIDSSYIIENNEIIVEDDFKKKKKFKIKIFLLYPAIIILILMVLYSYTNPGKSIINANSIGLIILRFVTIFILWVFIIGPFIMKLLRARLIKEQNKNKEDIKEVMDILPEIKYIFKRSWELSEGAKGFGRLRLFLKVLLLNVLRE